MIYRIDVRTDSPADSSGDGGDPVGQAVRHQIAEFRSDVGPIRASRIFLIDTDATDHQMRQAAKQLLADPIVETAEIYDHQLAARYSSRNSSLNAGHTDQSIQTSRIEIHLKPGVMDPVAASTEMALRDLGIHVRQVRTGRCYLIDGKIERAELENIASRVLANGVIESVHFEPFVPTTFETGKPYMLNVKSVAMTKLSEAELARLSREGHLFLSTAEMRAIQDYFRKQTREPTDIELETIAQTWSEHCVHKTLKSAVDVEVRNAAGQTIGRRQYDNLIRDTIFQSTKELMQRSPGFCLSVFKDNAGVIAFDEKDAVCFKVETHNHPSAIEPYGGSATGIGGVIRDILGTGLAAKPVANTDVFCVGNVNSNEHPRLPKGVIHPRRSLRQIVAGVRDYGNRMGIPTVNGGVYFDPEYVANPLVFCGCVGLIPRDKIEKKVAVGDAIVLVGGRTGRDGIHGATFSSAELTDTHSQEFSHAVQIGNAITEKTVADVVLQARDLGLFSAITDCGAGGLSSAIGEMAEEIGAEVHLDRVPLKYAGLRHDEIWISEAQERMVLSVPAQNVQPLLKLAADEDVEATVIGGFGTQHRELILIYEDTHVGQLSMDFLHHGLPKSRRSAVVTEAARQAAAESATGIPDFKQRLLAELANPNVASKHWIIRQYDHEVQGGSVIKPLIGQLQIGPSDAAVVRPKLPSQRGVAIGCGMAPYIADPYAMSIASIDEAIRNVIAVGADYHQIAILDNFCWPSVDDEITMGTLVRSCEACRDAARVYGIPFISGKDSLHNQFTDKETGRVIRIPNTLLISAIGIVPDVRKCLTMDLKNAGAPVFLVSANDPVDLASLADTHRAMSKLVASEQLAAVHDISDGGLAVAAAEMCIASGLGLNLDIDFVAGIDPFAPRPGEYLIEIKPDFMDLSDKLAPLFSPFARVTRLGFAQHRPSLLLMQLKGQKKIEIDIPIEQMTAAWRGTLDW